MNHPILKKLSLFFVLFLAFLNVSEVFSAVDIYPLPVNATKSSVFSIAVDDKEANVIKYMDYHYMHMGFDGNVSITIAANAKINTYKISPLSLGIEAIVNDNKLTFNLSQVLSDDETPRYLIVQINNLEKLVILGDRPEQNVPAIDGAGVFLVTAAPYSADPTGAASAQAAIQQAITDASNAGGGVVYVPYGLYSIKENLALKNNVELYLAPGAVLKAIDVRSQYVQNSTLPPAVIIHNVSNAKITGRGEIDGSGYKLMSPPLGFTSQSVQNPRRRVLQLDYSSNVMLNGIIVKDGSGWTVELMRSDNLLVQNVKVLNHKDVRYKIENDGINSVSSSNAIINQCFVITIDDSFCAKARYTNMDNCEFSNNVSFNWSGGVKAGMQSVGDMTNILFRNCDVIHCRRGVAIDTREGTKPITNVEFRDIRVEETSSTISGGDFLVEFESKLALISDIKIVRLTSLQNNKMKFFGSFDITNVKFENLTVRDNIIESGAQLNITKGSGIAIDYQFTTSTTNNEPDETHLIVNPSFEYKSEGELNDGTTYRGTPYGWSDTGLSGDSFGINDGAAEKDGNNTCWYQSAPMPANFELYQNINGLPAGEYEIRCRLAVDNSKITTQRLFANSSVQYYGFPTDYNLNLTQQEVNSFALWSTSTSSPLDLREMKVNVVVAQDETLKIGIRTSNKKADGNPATNNAGWFKVDHFRLKLIELHEQTGLSKIDEDFFYLKSEPGAFHVKFKEQIDSAHIQVVSLTGSVVYSNIVNQQNTRIPLTKGLYVIQIANGNVRKSCKVLIV
jgi:polygalacturonase